MCVHLQDRPLKSVENQRPGAFLRGFIGRLLATVVVAVVCRRRFFGMQEIRPDNVVVRVRRAERHGAGRQVEDGGGFGGDLHRVVFFSSSFFSLLSQVLSDFVPGRQNREADLSREGGGKLELGKRKLSNVSKARNSIDRQTTKFEISGERITSNLLFVHSFRLHSTRA